MFYTDTYGILFHDYFAASIFLRIFAIVKCPIMNYWKPQHEVFIRGMLRHGDKTKAYRAAYPKATQYSAYIAALRLLIIPHISEPIVPVLRMRYDALMEEAVQAAEERQAREAERTRHMRLFLAALVNREIKKERVFNINGRQVVRHED